MNKPPPPKEIMRITLADTETTLLPHCCVYILAYMGKILYVGKAVDIDARLHQHCRPLSEAPLPIDYWLQDLSADYANVRLDILVPPDNASDTWGTDAESVCIKRFRPLFNSQLAS